MVLGVLKDCFSLIFSRSKLILVERDCDANTALLRIQQLVLLFLLQTDRNMLYLFSLNNLYLLHDKLPIIEGSNSLELGWLNSIHCFTVSVLISFEAS